MHDLQAHRPDIVAVPVDLERDMSKNTHVSGTSTKPSIELFRVTLPRDLLFLRRMVDDLQSTDVVSNQAEAATKLAIPAGLDVAAEMDVGALAVGNEDACVKSVFERKEAQDQDQEQCGKEEEQRRFTGLQIKVLTILPQESIEFTQTMRNTRMYVALAILLKVLQILIRSKRRLQIKLNVVLSRRRSTTVLMTTSPDGNGFLLSFGVGNHKFDVFFVVGLDNETGGHVVVFEVGGGGILVAPLGVVD